MYLLLFERIELDSMRTLQGSIPAHPSGVLRGIIWMMQALSFFSLLQMTYCLDDAHNLGWIWLEMVWDHSDAFLMVWHELEEQLLLGIHFRQFFHMKGFYARWCFFPEADVGTSPLN